VPLLGQPGVLRDKPAAAELLHLALAEGPDNGASAPGQVPGLGVPLVMPATAVGAARAAQQRLL